MINKKRNQRAKGPGKRKTRLEILKQSRDRTPMPRPTVFRDKKKYDRNLMKDMDRKDRD